MVAAGVPGLLHFISLIGPVAVALLRDCVRLGFALCHWLDAEVKAVSRRLSQDLHFSDDDLTQPRRGALWP